MRFLVTGGSGFIGTNLIARLLSDRNEVLDLSNTAPLNPSHRPLWRDCDILNAGAVLALFEEFQPEVVIHLAARTDCVETTTVEAGYRVNTDGTANVLSAIKATPSVKRVLITSSQFVCGPGRLPGHDEDYFPTTVYGQSKVITEQLTRAANLACSWTLVRPTNIWGPWHHRYPKEFWRIAARGVYMHPGGKPVVRCYGYVGNVVHQMLTLLDALEAQVGRQTFYLGDPAADIYNWANGFCLALSGKHAMRVPRSVLWAAGLGGDIITAITGKTFYITSSRYRSMVTDYLTPMDKTFELLGPSPVSLEEGIRETVAWLRAPASAGRGDRGHE